MHATSDIDVGSAPARAPRSRALPRPGWLARALLFLIAPMSACVVPVGPSFQDPPATQDPPPYISSAMPPVATAVTITGTLATSVPQTFSLVVTDSEPGVPVWYRAALDYPAFSSSTRPFTSILAAQPLTDGSYSITFAVDCTVNPDPNLGSQHQLVLFVADQKFPGGSNELEQIPDPATGHVVSATWRLNMPCPATSIAGASP